MTKQGILIMSIIYFFCSTAAIHHTHAQTVPTRLDSLLKHTLDSMQKSTKVKSYSAAIQLRDNAVWAYAKGISSVTEDARPDHIYLAGSVAKTIISACILQLVDEGELHLDDHIYTYLDTLPHVDAAITIRQLLRHQSGLYDVLANPACNNALNQNMSQVWDSEDLIKQFILEPLAKPGTQWAYCNTNYFLLGMIIKAVTKRSFTMELRRRFFDPLQLNSFVMPAFETVNSPVSHIWLDLNGDNVLDDAHDYYYNHLALNSAAGAAGGYYVTAGELTRWTKKYMRGDLLSTMLLAEARNTVIAPGLQGVTYGLGMMKKVFLGLEAYGHGGDLGYITSSWYFPAKDISITVMSNDGKNNSWTLGPVVTALLKTYNTWSATVANQDIPIQIITELSVTPNPVNDAAIMHFNAERNINSIQLILQDIHGHIKENIIMKNVQSGDNKFHLPNINSLQSGVYTVQIRSNNHIIQTTKFIKI